MSYHLFIDKATGELVSEGVSMPDAVDTDRYEVREVEVPPDWETQRWDAETRAIVDRPPPVMVDRLDDLEQRFLADPDFAAVWGSLNATRKQQLRTGILRVLAGVLRGNRYRRDDDTVELD